MSNQYELELAGRALEFSQNPPEHLLPIAARHITDFIGVYTAGTEVGEIAGYLKVLRAESSIQGNNGPFNLDEPISRSAKASYLGSAGHMHDFDDDEPAVAVGHPTVAVAAAAFATAAPQLDSRVFLGAYLAGIEVINRIGECANPDHYNAGWHATATLGVFGGAVASGILRGAGKEELANALGFAASASTGLKAAFGSVAKPIQVGNAAGNAVLAAAMAASGLRAASGLVFGKMGWMEMLGDGSRVAEVIRGFGYPHAFEAPGLNIKLYPCCSSSHTAVDGFIDILTAEKIGAADIARVDAWIGPDIPGILIYDYPTTGLEGKFSLRYPLAAAALNGKVTLADFETERVRSSEAVEFMKRIDVHIDAALPRAPAGVTHCSRVRVTDRSGEVFERFTEQPRGSSLRPLSDEELFEKFSLCAGGALADGTRAAFDALTGMPKGGPLSSVMKAISLTK